MSVRPFRFGFQIVGGSADQVIAYHRFGPGGPGDDVVVLVNFGSRAYTSYKIGLPRAG